MTDVLISGWADGSLGGSDVENGSRLGALVAFRETASVLIVVYVKMDTIFNNVYLIPKLYYPRINFFTKFECLTNLCS